MFTDQIDKLKSQYTDKYVVVDGSRPELARFRDITGQVKTVNMSGRALVEFQDYHLNIGWFDIAPEFLKVIDKPLPKFEKPKAEKKPAAKAEAKPAAASKPQAASSPAAPKPAAAGKMSVADMLAAARGGAAPAKTDEAKPKAETAKPAETAGSSTPAKVDRSKMSVADMMAAARGEKAGGAAPAAKPPVEVKDAPVAKSPAVAAPTEAGIVKIDRSTMSIADMLAYARKSDGQG